MITFKKIPTPKLDPKTGAMTGIASVPKPANIGIDTEQFHRELIALHKNGIPLEQALKIIESHDSITDKPRAESMAQAVYTILQKEKHDKR